MKFIALLGLAAAFFVSTASAQLRIGTVDVKKVLDSYYKTKDAEEKVSEQRSNLKKEMEDRLVVFKRAIAEVQKLDEDVKRPELSAASRAVKQQELSEKAARLNARQREDSDYRVAREKELQELALRLHGEIVKEINRVVEERVKAEHYDIVFDRTSPSPNGVPVVLYANEAYDFTKEVLAALNKSKGSAPAVKTTEVRPATPPKKK